MKYLYYRISGYIGRILGCNVHKRKNRIIFKSQDDKCIEAILNQFYILPYAQTKEKFYEL